ncbi:thioredoxin family protein [Sediminibacterium ginsengisoli]|uniref:Thioredoxin-like domain-containing protein n=1 Tax=Sediminibacterium ginsengisoli TaxID=413434 RepID=A0A1T4R923_9BACT|nr:thioredoxin fold domain-containing protein [Sediminibacterium ginsengisoli]SKA12463.1 Thioredoxin-like domain-containing protein [Sediminibacterium ginsengisoli]
MKKAILLFLLLPALAFAQDKGMKFEHGLSWKDIQAKAKAEKKYIFMDCYTTWCGPCKQMSANVFPLPEVGKFYNADFINVKVQLDTTAADAEDIKKWYQDGHDIAAKYNVNVYPTYLFFDPNGNLVHRAVGSSEPDVFVRKGKDALNPEKQYYTLLNKYNAGEKAPAFVRNVALAALEAYDMKNATAVSNAYLASQTDLYTKENIEFLSKFTSSSKDKGFAVMMEHPEKVDAVLGKGKADQRVMAILIQEKVYPVVLKRNAPLPNFDSLKTALVAAYPKYGEEATAKGKVIYYQSKKDWNNFQHEIVAYMSKYGEKADAAELNSYAWTVFENCKDMTCVSEALDWSKRSFKDKDNYMYMDTYANILHKLGKTKEAIEWQTKAMNLAPDGEKKTYQETLDKMKKGEKTWTDK